MTSSNWNIFRVTGHLCREFTGHRWIPRTKASERGALMFSLICARINGWVSNREADDLRRHRAHYDVIIMNLWCKVSMRNKLQFDFRWMILVVHYWWCDIGLSLRHAWKGLCRKQSRLHDAKVLKNTGRRHYKCSVLWFATIICGNTTPRAVTHISMMTLCWATCPLFGDSPAVNHHTKSQ